MSVATQRNTQLDTERRNDRLSMRAAREAQNSLETTLTNVRGRQDGLDQAEAAARLHADGPNEVAHDRPPHVLVQLLQAFNNPFIYVLMTLSAISFFTDFWLPLQDGEETDLTGVIIVLCMVLVSGLMRFWQEYRSGKAAEALKAMVRNTATVLRRDERGMRGELREIPMGELVVGDIVRLSAGDMIPADIRLIESRDLFISQAVLTGEALPVEKYDTLGAVREKSAKRIAADQQDLLELPNICFMGTNVVSGTATAVVVATGARTYFGSLARSIVGSRAQTAFDRGVNSVSWLLIRFMLVMVPIVLLINGFTKGDWTEAFMFALAVAVGLTPEMLPMIVSANLAKGAVAMSRRKVVVKRLNAIQNFGAMDVLCTDKTGTLTQDRIILEHHVDVAGRRCDRVLQMAWLNSFHQSGMKNLMDRAVVAFVEQNPRITPSDAWRKVDELPFDFVRRRLSVILEGKDGEQLLVCKGAVEEMLEIATRVHQDGVDLPLDEERRRALLALAEQYNRDGFRVLLLGTRSLSRTESQAQYGASDERDLVIAGLLTFLDPPKETAGPAIAAKSLMVLEEGVIKGRETFGNIMKYLNMTASSSFGNVFSVLVASAFIPFLPMLAIHLLLQNLMYDISQLSLPWDKMDKEFLAKPRKWDSKNIGRFMVWIGPTSSIFDITTYALMWFVFAANSPEMQSLFQSGWFIEGLLSQTLVVHMLRTQKIPFIQSTAALPVMLMTGLVMALGIYVPFSPLGAVVGLQPLPWEYFPWLVGTLLCYCVTAQTMKTLYIRRFGQWF